MTQLPGLRRRHLLVAAGACALLAGCGRKGDLEVPPEEPPPASTAAPAPAPATPP